MPTRKQRIRKELRDLRATCIDDQSDLVLKRLAYEMECAVRYATEDGIKGWPTLADLARQGASMLKAELSKPPTAARENEP